MKLLSPESQSITFTQRFGRFSMPIMMVAIMWGIQIINMTGLLNKTFGLRSRSFSGLLDIFTFPFVHGGLWHIMANSFPLLILGCIIALGGTRMFLAVTGLIIVISGSLLWLVGPSYTVTVGASGIVFGYITYLIARAYFSPASFLKIGYIAVAIAIGLLYSATFVAGITPLVRSGISWQAHVCGAVAGVVTAWIIGNRLTQEQEIEAPVGADKKEITWF